jgi:hypothetical protein
MIKMGFFVDNPISHYNIGDRTPGLKNNTHGSLDISISSNNPGQAKESNWLPAPDGPFTLLLRMYIPDGSVVRPDPTSRKSRNQQVMLALQLR